MGIVDFLIIFALNGIGDIFRLVLRGIEGIRSILIAAGFLFYLKRPQVKAFFEKNHNK